MHEGATVARVNDGVPFPVSHLTVALRNHKPRPATLGNLRPDLLPPKHQACMCMDENILTHCISFNGAIMYHM